MLIAHLLNSTATLHRPSYAVDGRGGRVRSFSSPGSVRVKVNQPSAVERDLAQRTGAMLLYTVHTLDDVGRGDELELNDDRRLRVVSATRDSHSTYVRLTCEVVQGE